LCVLQGARAGNQVETLKNESDLPVPNLSQSIKPQTADINSVEPILSLCRLIQTSQNIQQRGFP
jgi:hypothetical protein